MTTLPTPKGWRLSPVRTVVRYLGGLAGAVSLVVGLGGLALARAGWWLIAVGVGVLWLARAARYAPGIGRGETPRLVTAEGETGVELPFSRVRTGASVVEDLGLAVVGLGFVFVPVTDGDFWHVAGGLALMAVGLGLALAARYGGGWSDPGLVLTPDGVTYAAGHAQWYVPWARVEEVRASSEWNYRAPNEWYVTVKAGRAGVERTDERHDTVQHTDSIEIAVDALAVDPRVAYWMLHHYARHPADRAELADARALRRGDLS